MSGKTTQQQKLGLAKLAESGLTLADAKKLKISFLSGAQTSKLHKSFKGLCALLISYFGPDGKSLADWSNSQPFYRLRYLEEPADFSSLTNKKKLRYVQLPDTAPVAYYPQNFDDWPSLIDDISQPLIITEGELKSAKACKEGFPTLGLGGVYNWRSTKLGITWLDSLEMIKWQKRFVYICFDSDYRTNPMVCAALVSFANELQRRGAFVFLVSLPQLPGFDKIGLDDFLVNAGANANDQFRELLEQAEPLGLAKVLWEFNEKYAYVRKPGFIVDLKDVDNKVSPGAFKDHLEATAQYQEKKIKADGSISYKAVSAAASWLKWPLRMEAGRVIYEPGQPTFVNQEGPYQLLNTWSGWGVEPKKGPVTFFLELIDHLFTGAEVGAKDWFLDWCAYPMQHPGVKLFSSVVIHGLRQGTGKSLIGYTLGKIYGRNFTEINQVDLHNHFNEWAENKQLALGDDVTGSNKRQDADFLKKMITQQKLRLNPKYIPSYEVRDCINYMFTSQHADSFFLEDDDRRFFIHEVVVGPMPDTFYKEYESWALNGDGAAAIFDWLLRRDLKKFNPAAHAYSTAAKARMINTGRSDLASWVRLLMENPDQVLRVGEVMAEQALFTSKELLFFYDPDGKTGTTANGLGRELSRAGVRQVMNGSPVKLMDGTQARYFAIRDAELWVEATYKQVTSHLDHHHQFKKDGKKKKY